MASEEDFGVDDDGAVTGCVEDAPVTGQLHGRRKISSRSAGSRRAVHEPRREEPDNDGRIVYQDDTKHTTDDNHRGPWYSNLYRCCRCCRSDDVDNLAWTKSDTKVIKYLEADDDIYRKMCIGTLFAFIHLLLALLAVFATYSMVKDLITSMKNPVRSVHYHKVDEYDAPGLAVYPGGAQFLACGHYYNNVVTSKVRMSDLDLVNLNCSFTRLQYEDPHYPGIERDVIVVRGPTSFAKREAIFLHFSLEDESRDFFTVSYFVFPGYDAFNVSDDQGGTMVRYHRVLPTFALSSGLRMWIKLIMSEANLMDNTNRTEFRVEYSVVKFWDRRSAKMQKKHLFFIFFEWKNNIIEQSVLLYTTTPWSIGAGLCGVFLTIHRGFQLAQVAYRKFKKEKRRRTIRKQTLRELRQKQLETEAASC